MKVIKVVSKT